MKGYHLVFNMYKLWHTQMYHPQKNFLNICVCPLCEWEYVCQGWECNWSLAWWGKGGGRSSWRGRRWTFWWNWIISRKMKWKGTIWRRKTMFQPFEKRRQSELTESDFLPTDEEASESFATYCQNYLLEFISFCAIMSSKQCDPLGLGGYPRTLLSLAGTKNTDRLHGFI